MNTKVNAVVDIHEPPKVHRAFDRHPEVESAKVGPLDAGDITIGDVVCERKTWGDYVASMTEERFPEQMAKLREADHAYVLVDGDLEETNQLRHTEMHPQSIRGHMASLTARESSGVHGVIPCGNLRMLADMAVRLARKHSEDPSTPSIVTGAVGRDEPTLKQMLGCVDGVGAETATAIYQWLPYDSIVLLQDAIADDSIHVVDGVGDDTMERLEEAFLA